MPTATINGEMWMGTTGEADQARKWLSHDSFKSMTEELKEYVVEHIGVKFFVRDPELFNGIILPVGKANSDEFLAKAKECGTKARAQDFN